MRLLLQLRARLGATLGGSQTLCRHISLSAKSRSQREAALISRSSETRFDEFLRKRCVEVSVPHAHALLGRQVHLVAWLHIEGGVPGLEIADDAVDPVFLGRVRVGQQLLTHCSFAPLALPRLCIGQKKALIAGKTVDHRRLAMPRNIAAI